MNETSTNLVWQEYEAGKEYHRKIGLSESVRRNERFYRGDQWYGVSADLPHPVFNLVRRITDHLVGTVLPDDISIHYSDDSLPFLNRQALKKEVLRGIDILNKHTAWRWKHEKMTVLSRRALLDAAITGDGIFYCSWDPDAKDGQLYRGDIRTALVDSTALFVADVNSSDLQSQKYILLAGRASVEDLRREASEAGARDADLSRIVPDNDTDCATGDMGKCELDGAEKATYLIRFFKENGEVIFEKWTRNLMIRRANTGLRLYPVAFFHWNDVKNCYHGGAPVSDMVANQRFINSAYAMAMKHMSDTAFSKVVYDKSRIPEWSNEVGEAIAVLGGGNVTDAVSVLGVGKLQDGYMELIDSVIKNTKGMMGATESALGDERANNTSAILALQQASQVALNHVKANFCRCIGELADIWADMLCTYCPKERLLAFCSDSSGTLSAEAPDYRILRQALLRAEAEMGHIASYSPSATVATLDKLLEGGHLNVRQYLKLLPAGTICDRETMLAQISDPQEVTEDESGTPAT